MGERTEQEVSADRLGAALARSVIQRAEYDGDGVAGLARTMNLDLATVRAELAYLAIVTMHFCVRSVLENTAERDAVLAAFYHTLWAAPPWQAHASGYHHRVRDYSAALNDPHPELGRCYGLSRVFARLCGADRDVAVIEFGARVYAEQLPPVLGLLRGVTIAAS